ncbi:hypothetical protein [Pelagibaculum spongiae]|uniref:Porin domain-containing protein n=1 Tax=Pelagibaculum spongiae TaxID=2080658 RepID=A0A2V1GZ95_9GAMM|nr:hypothetical protein [Pelagibaculum spongiae]PVZ71483.1 hypothetical protein DC094_00060 [Pelagibaculum spongiae]
MKQKLCKLSLAVLLATALPASAYELNGFASLVASKTNNQKYTFDDISNDLNTDQDTALGLQFGFDLTNKSSATIQLVARGDDNFDVRTEWAFLAHRFNDNLTLKGGRLKLPIFLISDYRDVGYAYPWIRPPSSIYDTFVVPFANFNGLDLVYRMPVGSMDLSLQAFGGSEEFTGTTGTTPIRLKTEKLYGSSINLSGDIFQLRANVGRLEGPLKDDAGRQVPVLEADVKTDFFGVALSIDTGSWLWMSEYVQLDHKPGDGRIFDTSNNTYENISSLYEDFEGWYATLGYRITNNTMLHYTHSAYSSDDVAGTTASGIKFPIGFEGRNRTLGLRQELDNGVALKMEAEYAEAVNNKSAFFTDSNNDTLLPNSGDVNVWIYSIGLDLTF